MRLLISLSAVLLGVGLVAPCLILYPSAGQFTNFLRVFQPSFSDPREVSILSGIEALIRGGEISIAMLLIIFSVLFPVAKLCVLWHARDAKESQSSLSLVESLGKYSMLDVLVLAVLVIAVKKLPGGSDAHLGLGAFAFAGSVALASLATWLLKRSRSNASQTRT